MKKALPLAGLWAASRQGDIESFSMIYKRLRAELYGYLLSIVKDDMAAKDLLQDLFIRLWEKKEGIGYIENVEGYFFRSARSLAINYLKKFRNTRFVILEQPAQFAATDHSPEDLLVEKENNLQMTRNFNKAFSSLPKRQREMLQMKFSEGRNYSEIAGLTGIRYQSVVNHFHRAMLHLRTELAGGQQPERSFNVAI
ncbi:RNA polymerase sigma factor [Hufsiella ginkgonis]|uniref:Sigma-70 family RNA polymerase sigma factor n=1 Tax=Hufsiella ginkgonis TaxID=2695274 RepID=A0A7K1XZE2_9SPHI|nr:sigma-70 family RNA polymerase sigma factor [Hufsiella ginkgonis]MXV16385.1 sigma-70 family RNA polymerase sigma factor [Hufsiella ginkgonis]